MNLMNRLVNMQYQLEQARGTGELEELIADEFDTLDKLLTDCMWALLDQKKANVA